MKLTTMLLLLLSVLSATPVFAFERRFPASMCTTKISDRGEMELNQGAVGNKATGTNWRTIKVECPVIVDDILLLGRIRRFNVDVLDNHNGANGQVSARACVRFRYVTGAVCAAGGVTTGEDWQIGWRELQASTVLTPYAIAPWIQYPIDYPYIEVTLPGDGWSCVGCVGASFISYVLGYTVSDIP